MKGRLLIIAALALVLTIGIASGGLYAADSINAYLGFSREVNEALSQRIQEKTGIEVKGITLSWGEIWARLVSEAPRFNADMVLSFGAAQAIDGTKKGYYVPYKSPTWDDIDAAFKSADGSYYALGTFSFLLIGNKKSWLKKGMACR
jgi:ABC-type glycerol-3-phosphate transport system substrate-binding protein